jgi:ubiquinone/menaquinone biosynthesis C-methylase UbiE
MTIRVDPELNEIRALQGVAAWRGKQVIEIGCGDGRLTLRLARLGPKSIQAIDPSTDLIRAARKHLPERLTRQIRYRVASAEDLKFSSNTFDMAVFSWVL